MENKNQPVFLSLQKQFRYNSSIFQAFQNFSSVYFRKCFNYCVFEYIRDDFVFAYTLKYLYHSRVRYFVLCFTDGWNTKKTWRKAGSAGPNRTSPRCPCTHCSSSVTRWLMLQLLWTLTVTHFHKPSVSLTELSVRPNHTSPRCPCTHCSNSVTR